MDGLNDEMEAMFKYLSIEEARQLNIFLDKIRSGENNDPEILAETPISG